MRPDAAQQEANQATCSLEMLPGWVIRFCIDLSGSRFPISVHQHSTARSSLTCAFPPLRMACAGAEPCRGVHDRLPKTPSRMVFARVALAARRSASAEQGQEFWRAPRMTGVFFSPLPLPLFFGVLLNTTSEVSEVGVPDGTGPVTLIKLAALGWRTGQQAKLESEPGGYPR